MPSFPSSKYREGGYDRRLDAIRLCTTYNWLKLVLNPSGASARLAEISVNEAASPWKDTNELKRFVCAFPSGTSQKRPHPVGE